MTRQQTPKGPQLWKPLGWSAIQTSGRSSPTIASDGEDTWPSLLTVGGEQDAKIPINRLLLNGFTQMRNDRSRVVAQRLVIRSRERGADGANVGRRYGV